MAAYSIAMSETRCALLPHRGVVTIGGIDRVKFLQGLVSNDVRRATADHSVYAALLTPQGKFLHDMFILADADTLWLDIEGARAPDLVARLSKYKLRSAVTIADMSTDYGVAVCPSKPDFNRAAPDPRHGGLGWRVIAQRADLPAQNDTAFVSYDRKRLSFGIADGSRDLVVGDSLLLEGNFDQLNGVDFTKGCYMGQELTARTHYRTLIKKRLMPVKATESSCPPAGTLLYVDGKEVGTMRSSQGELGIALLQTELAENRTLIMGGAESLTAGKLPT